MTTASGSTGRNSSGPPSNRSPGPTLHDSSRRWPNGLGNMLLIAAAGVIELVGTTLASVHEQPHRSLDVGGYALLSLGIAALFLRLRYPRIVLAVAYASTLVYLALGYPNGPVWMALLVSYGTAVWLGHRRAALVSVMVGLATLPWLGWLLGRSSPPPIGGLIALVAWLLALLSAVEVVRTRRERAREAVRLRVEAERRQAADERLRIARDIHDVVAHAMSLINIQAGVALHLGEDLPDQARQALSTIKQTSKDALVELRSILGVLRQVDDDAPRAPTPGMAGLEDLVSGAAAAGVAVELDVRADLSALPRSVDLAAYRIIQESLTNVVRHCDRHEALVRVVSEDGRLLLEVLDEGSPPPRRMEPAALLTGVGSDGASGGDNVVGNGGTRSSGTGNGIVGMRERAAAVGGRLEAGPRPGRGFAVRAELPLGAAT